MSERRREEKRETVQLDRYWKARGRTTEETRGVSIVNTLAQQYLRE